MYRALSILWMGLVTWFSSKPSTVVGNIPHPIDWFIHFWVFFALGFLLNLGIGGRRSRWRWIAIPLIASAFGATDEFHQMMTPGRSPAILDWIADTAGALASVAAYGLVRRQVLRESVQATG